MMWFEWKKLFERRLNVTAMIIGYVLIGACVAVWISRARFYDDKMQDYIEGVDAVRMDQQRAGAQTDILTEEYITQLVRGIQSHHLELESDEAYVEVIRPLGDLFWVTAKNYTDMREGIIDRNALNEIDLTDGAHFYEQRMKKITDFLNMDFSFGNYKEVEKTYWIQKAERTKTPFRWGSRDTMDMVWDLPVQLWDSVIPYNLTVGQACAANFAVMLLVSVATALVLLGCSAGTRSSLATLVIGMALMIAPAFFPMSKESGLWNHVNYLFPIRVVDLKTVLGSFVSYTVGSHVISYVEMIVIVYIVVSAIALLWIRRGWCR